MKSLSYYIQRRQNRSRKSRQPNTFTCFYTGLTLVKRADTFSGYTIEHLLPKFLLKNLSQQSQRKYKFDRIHRVPSISIINHLIGHAPLIVKYGLRDYLRNMTVDKTLPIDDQIEQYVHGTRRYLDRFRVIIGEHRVNHMPWYYASMAEQDFRDHLFGIYWGLLTHEERILWMLREEKRNG